MTDLDAVAVERLLSDSMTVHQAAWALRRAKKPDEAKAAMQRAYELRTQAHTLDPDHTLEIWTTPVMEGTRKGQHLHDELMAFYRTQLELA